MTHDYKRHGTTDLFAALNIATGEVLYDTKKAHKATDVLAFFKWIDLHVRADLEIHVILDNLSAHKAPPVAKWLADPKRARWHLHFTPTSSSWLNLIERWFNELTERRLRPGVFTSVPQLGRGHRDLGRALERRSEALHLAQAGRGDHRQGASRTGRPCPSQIRDAPLAWRGEAARTV